MRWSREVLLARLLRERFGDPELLAAEAHIPVPPKPAGGDAPVRQSARRRCLEVATRHVPLGHDRFATVTSGRAA